MSPQALLNLLLTGRARPHVSTGPVAPEDGPARGDVGYLHWSREQMERDALPQVESGSRRGAAVPPPCRRCRV